MKFPQGSLIPHELVAIFVADVFDLDEVLADFEGSNISLLRGVLVDSLLLLLLDADFCESNSLRAEFEENS